MHARRSQTRYAARAARAAALALQCERALISAARSTSVATRKRVRRVARDFVRRHRGNVRYLAWVVQRVAANAALAIALLGLGSSDAHAGAPVFDPFAPNPLAAHDVGFRASPALGDLDGDGDLDLISGEYGGNFHYFVNTGSATAPAYVERTGTANPANGFATSGPHSQPALADLDGDGDLDLVAGSYEGTFLYLRNTGDAVVPKFAVGVDPLLGADVGASSAPTLGDLDGDGDLDLVAGDINGTFHFFQNTGTATTPLFVERTGGANPLNGLSLGVSLASPALGDVDGDGDLDLVAGAGPGDFHFFQNTGSAKTPAFVELTAASNPFRDESVGSSFAKAALGDLDADGDLDLVGGADSGNLIAFKNRIGELALSGDVDINTSLSNFTTNAAADHDGDGDLDLLGMSCWYFQNTGNATNPHYQVASLPGISAGLGGTCTTSGNYPTSPATADLDSDGDIDLAIDGIFYENTGGASSPAFVARVSPVLPKAAQPYYSTSFADLDGDGDLDAAASDTPNILGTGPINRIRYYENTGSKTNAAYVQRTGSANPLDNFFVSNVELFDVDADGDSDAMLYSKDGVTYVATWFYLENIGTKTSALFRLRTDAQSLFDGVNLFTPELDFHDLDGDGDVDTLSGDYSVGGQTFVENGIIRSSPRYVGPITAPFAGKDVGFFSSPAAGDLDGDGDLDFVSGESFGTGAIHFLENTGSVLVPRIIERVGTANPFTGLNAGTTPILSLVDLESDGDLDLVAGGYQSEPLRYFLNTGTAKSPAYVERVSGFNPFEFVIADRSAPAFGDLDRDGDPDLVLGSLSGTFRYFTNFGRSVSAGFYEVTGAANPFNGLVAGAGFLSNPALGDIDLDGDLDLISGDEGTGGFFYFENTGTATAPAFVARTGPDNPLNGKSVGLNSTPTLVDLDADGDLDMVSGERSGTFKTFFLPEPSTPLLLTAGLGLLSWFAKRRKR